ncbi:hypothetical protein LAZ67_15001923 [Cordylochernes scorpioides]|uniref:PDEase domain-containing protein n=1 Tax=Cordylochernes scorpioides TaxID=51811 RepID=A0ABY6LDX9_9ARAC|nr:hypothetical protein LAZ67_15001923 [Cordylochernes scorpioides]
MLQLYDKIRRSEQKYKVALEILAYHNTCTEEEVAEARRAPPPPSPRLLSEITFSPYQLNSNEKVSATIYMFQDLFGLQRIFINKIQFAKRRTFFKAITLGVSRFEMESVIRFTLTVRKNYRRVPYHNWAHGFSVANAMYAIIKKAPGAFRPLEELSLFVACLCHDLDHRGKTNQFLVNSASPLAAIYTTSTLEHHHFNMTVTILQVLGNIKHCILATDLALFFPNKARLQNLVDEGKFDWSHPDHSSSFDAVFISSSVA